MHAGKAERAINFPCVRPTLQGMLRPICVGNVKPATLVASRSQCRLSAVPDFEAALQRPRRALVITFLLLGQAQERNLFCMAAKSPSPCPHCAYQMFLWRKLPGSDKRCLLGGGVIMFSGPRGPARSMISHVHARAYAHLSYCSILTPPRIH